MLDENEIVRESQRAIRREMERRGISLKQVQYDGGWDTVSTVASYFPLGDTAKPAIMSAAALRRLVHTKALPLDLLSLMLPPGFQIVRAPEEIDHDDFETLCRDYLAAKGRAHHPDSEAGREIGPGEQDTLDGKVVQLRAAA
jgi:hypothetical protein